MQTHRKMLKLEIPSTSYKRSQKSQTSEAAGCVLHMQREEERIAVPIIFLLLFLGVSAQVLEKLLSPFQLNKTSIFFQ